jgi:ferredoxin
MSEARTRAKREIIKINEEKCNGCGLCVISCAEGALKIINGKAKLVSETYCDGLGACIGKCPEDALIIEERESEGFDEKAVEYHLSQQKNVKQKSPYSCPSQTVTQFEKTNPNTVLPDGSIRLESELRHWPVQLTLVPPTAPFLKEANLLLVADCVPFAYADFHRDFVRDHTVLVACPKLDNFEAHLVKLNEILRVANPASLTVLHMEVPCCSGLVYMVKQALETSGKEIPFKDITIGIKGEFLETK